MSEQTSEAVHEFTEDVADGSMCVCGIPALTHDAVMRRRDEGKAASEQVAEAVNRLRAHIERTEAYFVRMGWDLPGTLTTDPLLTIGQCRAILAALDAATTERALACPNCGPGECACGLLAQMQRERASTTGGDEAGGLSDFNDEDGHRWSCLGNDRCDCASDLYDLLAARSVPASGAGEDGLREAVEALAGKWDKLAAANELARNSRTKVAGYYRRHATELRALLDRHAPGGGETGEGGSR